MIKNKILSSVAAVSLLSTLCIGFVPAHASVTETDPIGLEYVETGVSTSKQIDFYCTNDYVKSDGMYGFSIFLNVGTGFTKADLSITKATLTASTWNEVTLDTNALASRGEICIYGWTEEEDAVFSQDDLLVTLNMTVPENAEAFDVKVLAKSYVSNVDYEDVKLGEDVVFTVPGASTEPAGPTPIVADKVNTFSTYDDATVTVYTATVPAADVNKSFVWGFLNTAGVASDYTEPAKFGFNTVLTGEIGVVLGLKIVGDVDPNLGNVTLTEVE